MCQCLCHTDDDSTFIQFIFDFTSDLYSLPRTYTVYLGQYGFHPVLQVQLFKLNDKCILNNFYAFAFVSIRTNKKNP